MNLSFTVELQSVHLVHVIMCCNDNSSVGLYEDSHSKQHNILEVSTLFRNAMYKNASGSIILYKNCLYRMVEDGQTRVIAALGTFNSYLLVVKFAISYHVRRYFVWYLQVRTIFMSSGQQQQTLLGGGRTLVYPWEFTQVTWVPSPATTSPTTASEKCLHCG